MKGTFIDQLVAWTSIMESSQVIFDDLQRTGSILHGILKPDPQDAAKLLIAPADDLSQWTCIPVSGVRTVTKVGAVNGLPSDHHLVNVAMTSDFSPDLDVQKALEKLTSSTLATAIVPVFCYDHETHRQIPCP